MGRKKKSDSQFHLRIDSELLNWFRSYCKDQGINMSDFVREYLEKVKRSDERRKRKEERQREADRRQLPLFDRDGEG